MTDERHRLLRHMNKHPEPSFSGPALALGCQYRRVMPISPRWNKPAGSTIRTESSEQLLMG